MKKLLCPRRETLGRERAREKERERAGKGVKSATCVITLVRLQVREIKRGKMLFGKSLYSPFVEKFKKKKKRKAKGKLNDPGNGVNLA